MHSFVINPVLVLCVGPSTMRAYRRFAWCVPTGPSAEGVHTAQFGVRICLYGSRSSRGWQRPRCDLLGDSLAVDAAGDLFVADNDLDEVVEFAADGSQTMVGAGLNPAVRGFRSTRQATSISPTARTNVRSKVTPSGTATVVKNDLQGPVGVASDAEGDVFIAEAISNEVIEVTPAGPLRLWGLDEVCRLTSAAGDQGTTSAPRRLGCRSHQASGALHCVSGHTRPEADGRVRSSASREGA